jgi:hypothetical protein
MNISHDTGCLECGREPSPGPQEDKPNRGPPARGQKRRGKQMNSRTVLNPQICHVEDDRVNLSQHFLERPPLLCKVIKGQNTHKRRSNAS